MNDQKTTGDASYEGFTADERAAMKHRAKELKASARRGPKPAAADGESDVLAKLAEMQESDRVLGERIHAIVKAVGPDLTPRLWYGMPAYAKGSNLICFFQSAQKFKSRYATLGFSDKARLDEGTMWPVYFALTTELSEADEARIAALIRQAMN